MAQPSDLRKRLASAAGVSITDKVLDQIHEQLKLADEPLTIPINLKYNFSVDDDGVMEVKVNAVCNLNLYRHTIALRGDGPQLQLAYDGEAEPEEPEDPLDELEDDDEYEDEEDAAAEEEAARLEELQAQADADREARVRARAKKKKAAAKKGSKAKGSKKAGKVKKSKSKRTERPGAPKKGEAGRAAAAKADHVQAATELYREGSISREMAIAGGVDVDLEDGEAHDPIDRIGDLTAAEKAELQSSLT